MEQYRSLGDLEQDAALVLASMEWVASQIPVLFDSHEFQLSVIKTVECMKASINGTSEMTQETLKWEPQQGTRVEVKEGATGKCSITLSRIGTHSVTDK